MDQYKKYSYIGPGRLLYNTILIKFEAKRYSVYRLRDPEVIRNDNYDWCIEFLNLDFADTPLKVIASMVCDEERWEESDITPEDFENKVSLAMIKDRLRR